MREVKRSTVMGAFAGVILGAGGVLLLASVGSDDSVAPVATTSTSAGSQSPQNPVWIDSAETVIGPAVIIPDSVRLEEDEVVFRYELQSLAPRLGHEVTSVQVNPQSGPTPMTPDDLDPVYPTAWTMVAGGQEITGSTSNPRARSARFAVTDDFVLDAVNELRLDGYRIPVPINIDFVLDEDGPAEVAPGVSVAVVRVAPQGEQTILQVEILAADPTNREHLTIEGTTAAWLSAVREAEGRPRYNLRYAGGALPDPLVLRARGYVWLPVDTVVPIDLESLDE